MSAPTSSTSDQTKKKTLALDMTQDHLVQALHEHFDRDRDGYLNFGELAALQLATSGESLTADQYVMVCRTLDCSPGVGISLTALRLTYASDGTNAADDYTKVFGREAGSVRSKEQHTDDIYEVDVNGGEGVDISS